MDASPPTAQFRNRARHRKIDEPRHERRPDGPPPASGVTVAARPGAMAGKVGNE